MSGFGYTLRYFLADLAGMILFFVLVLVTGNIYLATGVGMGVSLVQIVWALARKAPIGVLQWTGLGLVAVFGTATLLTHDPRFIMFKPTVVHGLIGATMLKKGWMSRYTPPAVREIAKPLMDRFGYVWAGLMFAIGGLNIVVMLLADPATWAKINLFADPVLIGGLFLIQNAYMRMRAARAGVAIPASNASAG